MRIEHKLQHKLTQELKVTPQMILINRILQMQRLELRDEIEQVLKENPALEITEEMRCTRCGEPLDDSGVCRNCESNMEFSKTDFQENRERVYDDLVSNWDAGHFEDSTTYEHVSSDDEFDPISNTPGHIDFHEEIKRSFLITYSELSEVETTTAEFMISLIDDKGLIEIDDKDLSEELGVLIDVVSSVRDKLMRIDPIGIGARSPAQAMSVQLDMIALETGRDVSIEKRILTEYRDLLAKEDYKSLSKLLNVETERILLSILFIKEHLYAYPGSVFETSSIEETDPDFYPEPDVIIRCVNGEYYPEVLDSGLPQFKISGFYADAYQKIKNKDTSGFTPEEIAHIKQYFEKAEFFMMCINQRRETIIRICNYLIKYQKEFLDHGIRKLKDLTREKVANDIGFHPSTISRALKDKYVQLPDKSIASFDVFFDYQKVLILLIKEIIQRTESLENMLSDEELALEMKKIGFEVARRTIAKYRERGKIPPKNIRKQRLLAQMDIGKGKIKSD